MRGRAAFGLAALAAASALVGLPHVWGDLEGLHDRYGSQTRSEAEHEAGTHHHFDAAGWDFFRAQVGKRERYYLETPKGEGRGFVDEGTVARTYASFWLLPGIQVTAPGEADVILSYKAPPATRADCLDAARLYCVRRAG